MLKKYNNFYLHITIIIICVLQIKYNKYHFRILRAYMQLIALIYHFFVLNIINKYISKLYNSLLERLYIFRQSELKDCIIWQTDVIFFNH
jgi:hypothetical protein